MVLLFIMVVVLAWSTLLNPTKFINQLSMNRLDIQLDDSLRDQVPQLNQRSISDIISFTKANTQFFDPNIDKLIITRQSNAGPSGEYNFFRRGNPAQPDQITFACKVDRTSNDVVLDFYYNEEFLYQNRDNHEVIDYAQRVFSICLLSAIKTNGTSYDLLFEFQKGQLVPYLNEKGWSFLPITD